MEKIGFTTTIPVEVVLAAGMEPVDLNNVFIAQDDPDSLVGRAEAEGLPRTTCGWIKGLYVTARKASVGRVVAVTQGDCSNTHALMELWQSDGMEVIPFAYPYDRDMDLLRLQIRKLMDALGASEAEVMRRHAGLAPLRRKLARLDEMTWREGRVSGLENHRWLVGASDFGGDPELFEARLDEFVSEAARRAPAEGPGRVRIGYIGVPPIYADFHEVMERSGAPVVFNEVQRQFSMPGEPADVYVQYARYTYPYDVFGRIHDIKEQARVRRLDGIVHYCQSFCFRAIEDMLIRREVRLPILTVEGDRPGPVDARTRLRIEGFAEMLRDRRASGG